MNPRSKRKSLVLLELGATDLEPRDDVAVGHARAELAEAELHLAQREFDGGCFEGRLGRRVSPRDVAERYHACE